MDRQPWLKRVDREMARQGIPIGVRCRLLAEWRDHLVDLMEEGNSMAEIDLKMGEPLTVAADAATQHRLSGWAQSHPLLAFGIAPIPLAVVAFVGIVLLLELVFGGIAYLLYGDLDNLPRPVTERIVYGLHYSVRLLPFVLLSAWFTRLFLRSGVRRVWYGVAMAQVLLLAGTFMSVLTISEIPGESTWKMGFALAASPSASGWMLQYLPAIGWDQVSQVAVTVVMAWTIFLLSRWRQQPSAAFAA